MAPRHLSLLCFRYKPQEIQDERCLDQANQQLLQALNTSGELYLSHCRLQGKLVLRLCVGQTYTERHHVEAALKIIFKTARGLRASRQ